MTIATPKLLENDSDVDQGDILSVLLVNSTIHGTLILNGNGSFTYTPKPNFNGTDSFSYKVRDAACAESEVVTVNLTVNPVNDAPTIAVAAGGLCYGDTARGMLPLVVGDEDNAVAGLTLSGSSADTSLVTNSNIVFGGGGAERTITVTATPAKNTSNTRVTVSLSDGPGGTETLQLTIVVGTTKRDTLTAPGLGMIWCSAWPVMPRLRRRAGMIAAGSVPSRMRSAGCT